MSEMKVKDPGNVQTTSVHPLVRTHPETGRKSIYIGGHVQNFDGMTDEESQPLIDFFMHSNPDQTGTSPAASAGKPAP